MTKMTLKISRERMAYSRNYIILRCIYLITQPSTSRYQLRETHICKSRGMDKNNQGIIVSNKKIEINKLMSK